MARILTLPSATLTSLSVTTATVSGTLTLSGTTGNILACDTNVLIVDATNNRVGINVTSPSHVLQISDTGTDPAATVSTISTNQTWTLTTNNAQVVRALGTSTNVNQAGFNHTASTGGVRGLDCGANATGASGTVTLSLGVRSSVGNTGAGTLTSGIGYLATAVNSGGGTFGTFVGYDMPASTIGSTATYGYRGQLASAATRWNLYMDGTAQNYLAGNLGIGVTAPTNSLSFGGNAARTIWMERHTTADTAGNSLTIQAGGATSGATNKTPGDLIPAAGLGTGNARPGRIRLRRGGRSVTSGTTDQTLIDGLIIGINKDLTDNTLTNIISATIADGSAVGYIVQYHITATDLTDWQSETGTVLVSAVNKGGVITATINEVSSQQAVSAGTLSSTWAASAANPSVLSLTADTSLTVGSGHMFVDISIHNLGHQALSIV